MELGQIIEVSCQTAQLALPREAREGLIDSGALGEVQEVAGRKRAPSSAGQGARHDLVGSREARLIHASENMVSFSDVDDIAPSLPVEAIETTASV